MGDLLRVCSTADILAANHGLAAVNYQRSKLQAALEMCDCSNQGTDTPMVMACLSGISAASNFEKEGHDLCVHKPYTVHHPDPIAAEQDRIHGQLECHAFFFCIQP